MVTCCAWSGDGKRILSSSNDGTLKIWDADKGTEILSLKGTPPRCAAVRGAVMANASSPVVLTRR